MNRPLPPRKKTLPGFPGYLRVKTGIWVLFTGPGKGSVPLPPRKKTLLYSIGYLFY